MKSLIGVGLIFAFWACLLFGWFLNLIQVIQLAMADVPLTTYFVLKVVGIFLAPLGTVLGYVG